MIWTSKFKKLISHPKTSIQNNLLQDSQNKLSKCKDRERILRSKEKKKILSRKRTPLRRSADLSKETLQTTTVGLMTYSNLTQGEAAPREGQERAREKELPTESQQILGRERTVPGPQHDRKRVTGTGAGTWELIHVDFTSTDLYRQEGQIVHWKD